MISARNIDKYQAFRRRGGRDHKRAMEEVEKIIKSADFLPARIQEICYQVCDKLDSKEQEINLIMAN